MQSVAEDLDFFFPSLPLFYIEVTGVRRRQYTEYVVSIRSHETVYWS